MPRRHTHRYAESYDHIRAGETSWILRRDLRPGGSYGRVFMAVDGTLITRTEAKGMMSNVADTIVEEYWRLEEGGNVLVARQCAYHVSVLCAGWRGGDRAWCICKVRGVCMWALREGEGGNTIEEYWRLEEGDNVLVVKQCAYMYVRGWRKEKGLGRRGRKGEMGKGEAVRREGNALVCRQHCHHVSCMGKGGEARD